MDWSFERVAGPFDFTEGPAWIGDHLLFTDIPNSRIMRYDPKSGACQEYRTDTNRANGLTLGRDGRLYACEGGATSLPGSVDPKASSGRRIVRYATGEDTVSLADTFEGKRLNSPNDIVVKSDGAIYFTDPPYAIQPGVPGMPRGEGWWANPIPGKEQSCNGVYRLGPDGTLDLLVDDFALPNGLAFSPDESILYVDDSARKQIRAFDVGTDGGLSNNRILLDMSSEDSGVPDGLKVDQEGNVFCTGPGGVWVCRANGEYLGRIILPELPANLGWGEDGSVLFLTARTSIYRLQTKTAGAPPRREW